MRRRSACHNASRALSGQLAAIELRKLRQHGFGRGDPVAAKAFGGIERLVGLSEQAVRSHVEVRHLRRCAERAEERERHELQQRIRRAAEERHEPRGGREIGRGLRVEVGDAGVRDARDHIIAHRAELGLSPLDAIAASATTLGNVGPAFGVAGPMGSFAPFSDVSKGIMIALMWIGRLEIIPVRAHYQIVPAHGSLNDASLNDVGTCGASSEGADGASLVIGEYLKYLVAVVRPLSASEAAGETTR